MYPSRFRARSTLRRAILGVLLSASSSGCGDTATNSGASRRGSLLFDLRSEALDAAGAGSLAASVIDSLTIDITLPTGAGVATHGRKIGPGDSVVAFDVSAPDGVNTFRGAVLSATGVLLYDGSETQEIRSDGFTVDLRLRPVAPVLVIDPDSLDVGIGSADSSLVVLNRGTGVLSWRHEAMEPANTSCDPAPCLLLQPAEGQLGPGLSQRIHIRTNRITPRVFTLTFSSPQGALEVHLVVIR